MLKIIKINVFIIKNLYLKNNLRIIYSTPFYLNVWFSMLKPYNQHSFINSRQSTDVFLCKQNKV